MALLESEFMNLSSKPAIIFDFGGVLLNLSYQATVTAFEQLGAGRLSYHQFHQENYFDLFERGEISAKTFRRELRRSFDNQDLSDARLDEAWNAMLGDLPRERIDLLAELSENFRLFLLSNTNEIHKTAFDQTLLSSFSGDPQGFDRMFEASYYSHLIAARKPEPQAYQHIIERHGLRPENTWFIDDNEINVKAATSLGIQAIHLTEDLLAWYLRDGRQILHSGALFKNV